MAGKLELLQEAERRGILPPDKIALLREAERRGLGQKPSLLERFGRLGIPEGGTGILPSKETVARAGELALEAGPALGELGVGAFQRGAEILGREDISRKVGQQLTEETKDLTPAQRAARVGFQTLATAPIAAGGALITGVIKGAGAVSALTPTEEGTAEAAVKQIGTGVTAGLATAGIIKGVGGAATKAKQLGQEAIKRVKSGIGARNVEALENATATLKQKSSDLYDRLRKLNSDINPKAATKLVTKLDKTLIESGKLNKRLHGNTMSVVDDIRVDAKAGEISLEGLDQHRQNLSAVIKKDTDSITGTVGPDGQKATVMMDKLDDLIDGLKPSDLGVRKAAAAVSDDLKPLAAQAKQFDNVDDFVERIVNGDASGITKGKDFSTSPTQALEARALLKEAQKDWKVYKKFQRIANLAERADGDPNRAKQIFQQFVRKKKNLRGFTPDEVKALRVAATNTAPEKLLKSLGKFGFDFGASATQGNTFLPVASLATGATGSPIGPALTAAGTVARKAQKLTASGKVEDALKLIEQGGVSAAEVISKMPSQKARQELLTRLFSVGTAQQSTQN